MTLLLVTTKVNNGRSGVMSQEACLATSNIGAPTTLLFKGGKSQRHKVRKEEE